MIDLNSRAGREALDRHITGNYGEDQFKNDSDMDPCINCEGYDFSKCDICGEVVCTHCSAVPIRIGEDIEFFICNKHEQKEIIEMFKTYLAAWCAANRWRK